MCVCAGRTAACLGVCVRVCARVDACTCVGVCCECATQTLAASLRLAGMVGRRNRNSGEMVEY